LLPHDDDDDDYDDAEVSINIQYKLRRFVMTCLP
jgi:hypothetical protein